MPSERHENDPSKARRRRNVNSGAAVGPEDLLIRTKVCYQGLKRVLESHDPWAREGEQQRLTLRKLYVELLLAHPSSKEAKEAESLLWMHTSYSCINIYKQQISKLESVAYSDHDQDKNHSGSGVVEYRKLVQRFRQFLAEEEKFWLKCVLRLHRLSGLDAVERELCHLGIIDPAMQKLGDDDRAPSGVGSADVRNWTSSQKAAHVLTLSHGLIYLGDIARYRELYNESGGRPRAGHNEGPPASAPRRGGRKRSGDVQPGGPQNIARERSYERAQRYYESSRRLTPSSGNAFHQLAILNSYKRDAFTSLMDYYRALCVRHPFETASSNMVPLFNKAMNLWNKRRQQAKSPSEEGSQTLRDRVDRFKEEVIVLHAMWKTGTAEKQTAFARLSNTVCQEFQTLVAQRVLPETSINDMTVIVQGAFWKQCLPSESRNGLNQKSKSAKTFFSPVATDYVFAHALRAHQVLFEVATREIQDGAHEVGTDPAQKITGTLRRMLPSLRLALKWTRANYSVLDEWFASMPSDSRVVDKTIKTAWTSFWAAFEELHDSIRRVFPEAALKGLQAPLDEDIQMRGFLPIRGYLYGGSEADEVALFNESIEAPSTGLHPNEEHLMRIMDLLCDAKEIVKLQNIISGDTRVSTAVEEKLEEGSLEDVDAVSHASTEDLFEAVRKEAPPDSDEDEVVYDPGRLPNTSPRQVTPTRTRVTSFGSPFDDISPPTQNPVVQDRAAAPKSASTGMTAESLLNSYLKPPQLSTLAISTSPTVQMRPLAHPAQYDMNTPIDVMRSGLASQTIHHPPTHSRQPSVPIARTSSFQDPWASSLAPFPSTRGTLPGTRDPASVPYSQFPIGRPSQNPEPDHPPSVFGSFHSSHASYAAPDRGSDRSVGNSLALSGYGHGHPTLTSIGHSDLGMPASVLTPRSRPLEVGAAPLYGQPSWNSFGTQQVAPSRVPQWNNTSYN